MEPLRNGNATLVDLLDRVLEKGLVIHADLIVSVAGIPLIGVNLRAALASMETMLKYGVMQAGDERIRSWERENRNIKATALLKGENVLLKTQGACFAGEGIYTAWKYGCFYLTDQRLVLYHQDFGKVLFEAGLENITGLTVREEEQPTGETGHILYLFHKSGHVFQLRTSDTPRLKQAIARQMDALNLTLGHQPEIPSVEENPSFIPQSEQLICHGKIWHLVHSKGILDDTWKPGRMYLTNQRLYWCHDFEQRVNLDIAINKLAAAAMETKDLSGALKQKRVLDIIYGVNGKRKVALFSGNHLEDWYQALNRIINRPVRPELRPALTAS